MGLCLRGDRSLGQVSRDLDLTISSVRNWVKQAKVDLGQGPPGAITSAEREELSRLRREVRRLREERAISKKAATFFAVVIDLYSRRVVGWAAADHLRTELPLEALAKHIEVFYDTQRLHSNLGSTTSADFERRRRIQRLAA